MDAMKRALASQRITGVVQIHDSTQVSKQAQEIAVDADLVICSRNSDDKEFRLSASAKAFRTWLLLDTANLIQVIKIVFSFIVYRGSSARETLRKKLGDSNIVSLNLFCETILSVNFQGEEAQGMTAADKKDAARWIKDRGGDLAKIEDWPVIEAFAIKKYGIALNGHELEDIQEFMRQKRLWIAQQKKADIV